MTKKTKVSAPSIWTGAEGLRPLLRPLAELRVDPRNARKHPARSISAIALSLSSFGQRKPIVVRPDGVVVAGNGTLEAARNLGWPCIAATSTDGMTEEQIKAFALVDNRSAELSEWDDHALATSLAELPAIVLPDLGWSPAELRNIMGVEAEAPIPEPPKQGDIVSKTGEVYDLGCHRLVCGDCTSASTWDALDLRGRVFSFTSPPYAMTTAHLRGPLGKGNRPDSLYEEKENIEGWPALMCSFASLVIERCEIGVINVQMLASNKRALMIWLSNVSDHVVDVAIWDKGRAAPALAPKVLNSRFEFMVILSKQKNPSRSITTASHFRGKLHNVFDVDPGNNDMAAVHRAVFPLALPLKVIETMAGESDVVVDCFAGTGTTMIAAAMVNKPSRLIEISNSYCDVIRRRWGLWAAANGQDPGPGAL